MEDGNRATLTVPEAARVLGISRNHAFELARAGVIPALRLGRRLVIPQAALQRMLDQVLVVSHSDRP